MNLERNVFFVVVVVFFFFFFSFFQKTISACNRSFGNQSLLQLYKKETICAYHNKVVWNLVHIWCGGIVIHVALGISNSVTGLPP